jgi:hypothetical protein
MRHMVIGMSLIALGLWGISTWWDAFAVAMRGVVPLGALVWGVLAVLSSYSRLGFVSARKAPKDSSEAED